MFKRLSLVFVSFIAALLLTACGDNAEKKVETTATEQVEQAPQATVEPAAPAVEPVAPQGVEPAAVPAPATPAAPADTVEPVKPADAPKDNPDVSSAADANNQQSAKNEEIPAVAAASANQELAKADFAENNANADQATANQSA